MVKSTLDFETLLELILNDISIVIVFNVALVIECPYALLDCVWLIYKSTSMVQKEELLLWAKK